MQLVVNDRQVVRDTLEAMFADADSARIAVAYARGSGLEEIPALRGVVQRARELRFLAGVDFQLTDLDTLAALHRPPTAETRVYLSPADERQNFHPKVYLARKGDEVSALVGSSNFTAGGFRTNVEANVLIRAGVTEPPAAELLAFHDRLWSSPLAVEVSAPFRASYERLQERRRRAELDLRREPNYEQARRHLQLAVSEAVASFGDTGGRSTWLMVTSPENYILCQRARIWGDERRGRLGKIRRGDILVFYIRSLHEIGQLALVTAPLYEDRTPYWLDRAYPYRLGFLPLAEPTVGLSIRPLIPSLELFRGSRLENWGQKLQRSQIELSPADARLMRAAILQAAGLPATA